MRVKLYTSNTVHNNVLEADKYLCNVLLKHMESRVFWTTCREVDAGTGDMRFSLYIGIATHDSSVEGMHRSAGNLVTVLRDMNSHKNVIHKNADRRSVYKGMCAFVRDTMAERDTSNVELRAEVTSLRRQLSDAQTNADLAKRMGVLEHKLHAVYELMSKVSQCM